jgi:CheY-like chemotaxis protein
MAMNSKIPTLLIAEDDDNDFLFLERALKIERFEADIRRACDGEEAIEYLGGEEDFANREAHPLPQLILLDLKMPRKNGFDVLTWVREHPDLRTLPVIIFSSSEEPEDVENAYNLGANAYLVKPSSCLSYSEVVQTLRQFLVKGCVHVASAREVTSYQKPLRQ